MRKYHILLLFLLLGHLWLTAQTERILNYETAILVNADRSIQVTETIEVVANREAIKRGIVRRLPTSQNGRRLRYRDIEVLRDGKEEPFHTESGSGQLSVYIGERDVLIPPGTYTYTLSYRAPNEVRFFKEYDEVYWNAVGTDWDFPVEQARCSIQLPDSVEVLQTACYTGPAGAQEKDCQLLSGATANPVTFELTQPLSTREGFTVAVGFDKGFVQEPTFWEKYKIVIILGIGALLMIVFFIYTSFKYGLDPPKPAVYPVFYPPKNLSPASTGYLLNEKYDPDLLTAAIIQLAVKGYIFIEEEEKKILFIDRTEYTLKQLKTDLSGLPREERELMKELFRDQDIIVIDRSYDPTVRKAMKDFKSALKTQHNSFLRRGDNTRLVRYSIWATVIFAIICFILIVRTSGQYGSQGEMEVFLIVFITIFSVFLNFFISSVRRSFKSLSRSVLSLFIMFMFIGVFTGNLSFSKGVDPSVLWFWQEVKRLVLKVLSLDFLRSLWEVLTSTYLNVTAFVAFLLFSFISIWTYRRVIKQPSTAKQKLQSELEGFKQYLEMTEKDRLELLNPPERTPEHFEAMLPYAYAMGVAHKWSEQFREQLEKAAYEAKWSNSSHIYSSNNFSSGFSRTMSSASSPPSSSGGGSGSSGGGSSGGGGGGGGGGGW